MPKPNVTLYGLYVDGLVFRHEGQLDGHERTPVEFLSGDCRGDGPAPCVRLIPPGRRTADVYSRDRANARYLLVLAGYGHPDPTRVRHPETGETNAHRDPSILAEWDAFIDDYCQANGVRIIADYRDITREARTARTAS